MDKYNIIKEDFEYGSELSDYEVDRIKDIKIDELNQDPTIAIINWNVKTEEDLNKIYNKYSLLPRKFKRFSNYYSTQLLGYNVPNMYALMVDKLIDNDYIFGKDTEVELTQEAVDIINEKFIGTEPDLYYNQKKFNEGKTNLCFILGHSGSGKSIMSKALKGNGIDHIELDDLLLVKDHFTMKELKEYSPMLYDFFNGPGKKYYIGYKERENIPKEQYEDKVFIDFVNYAMRYAAVHKNRKFIVEGIWIYLYFPNPAVFKDYAVFIKGTSFLKSKIRTAKRESKRDKEELNDRKKMFSREFRNYLLDENKINKYRKYYENLPETELKKEVSAKNPKNINEDVDVLIERTFKSEPDLYYHQKEFDSGDINLCFVIGYSGSGKTVLTRKYKSSYKGAKVEKVELDDIVCIKDHFTMEELKEYSPMMYSFFHGVGKKYYIGRKERSENKDHKNVFHDFITYAMRYANSHKDTKFILEGIWVYLFFDSPTIFDKYAVYMKGTSKMKAKMRRMKREIREGKQTSTKDSIRKLKEFGIYMTDTMLHDNRIDKWRKHFEEKPETVLKKENGTVVREEVQKYIDRIDEYVVRDKDLSTIFGDIGNDEELTVQEVAMLEQELVNASRDLMFEPKSSGIVPWFTPDETYSNESAYSDPEYANKLNEAAARYKYLPNEQNKEALLKLGWNPSLAINEATMNKARERQDNWFKQKGISVNELSSVNEVSILKKMNDKELEKEFL